jgi:hypothetical protein
MAFKALELVHRPGHECLIDMSQQGIEGRWGVSPVVLDPTPQERIELPSNVLQRHGCLLANGQVSNRRPHGFHCRRTDRRSETAEQHLILGDVEPNEAERSTRGSRVRRSDTCVCPSVFAVNDFGFGQMHLHAALSRHPALKRMLLQRCSSLSQAVQRLAKACSLSFGRRIATSSRLSA